MRFRVDLRSDTVSTPSDAMRAAMAAAEVGDAWYGDDPTVNRLQERAAELTGTEAALYVATGTMANQIGLRLHISGQGHLVAAEDGRPRRHHRDHDEREPRGHLVPHRHRPSARLHDRRPGRATPRTGRLLRRRGARPAGGREHGRRLRAGRSCRPRSSERFGRSPIAAGVPIHMDGARIWNAAAASGEPVTAWTVPGRHDDVLPLQGPRGADRLDALRPGRADPRGASDLDPLRRRLAAGRASWPPPV